MKVGYNKAVAFLLIGLGGFSAGLATLTSNTLTMLSGGLVVLCGVLFAAGQQIEVTEREVRFKNLFGMTLKRYSFDSPGDLAIDGKKLFIQRDGIGEQVKGAGGFMADAGDWRRLETWINEQRRQASEQTRPEAE